MHATFVFAGFVACALVQGCGSTAPKSSPSSPDAPGFMRDVAVSTPPFSEVHATYKERLEQPYVALEVRGNYALAGRRFPELAERMQAQGLVASGPPFALFHDDPGAVATDALRAELCFPVEVAAAVEPPLSAGSLPSCTVAYAVASGAYPEVPRCYPGLLAYVRTMHWVVAGPIREVYLVPPQSVKDWSELRCEVQVPVAMAP